MQKHSGKKLQYGKRIKKEQEKRNEKKRKDEDAVEITKCVICMYRHGSVSMSKYSMRIEQILSVIKN